MSKNKVLLKDRVLSRGGTNRRAILCYDSGLVYQAQNPENILCIYDKGKGWVSRRAPQYSSGGWGRHSTGDGDGYNLVSNARDLVKAIGGNLYTLSSDTFLTQKELSEINNGIAKNNKLIKKQNELARRLGRSEFEISLVRETVMDLYLESRGKSPKGFDAVRAAEVYADALKVFIERKGKTVRCGDYSISKDVVKQGQTVVAFRDAKGDVFMNSQVLDVSDFEKNFMGGQSMIQAEIRKIAKYSVPFNVLAAANLNLNETKILEQGPESTHLIYGENKTNKNEERHFTGALLLENSGRKFLMDIDRIEIEHGLFNAFFVEVNTLVKTIAEAYETMKPQEVRDAEKAGIEVKRQGEWFFIATEKTITVDSNDIETWERTEKDDGGKASEVYVLQRAVAHGKGRPNNLYVPMNAGPEYDGLVCGTVTHQGREHADLDLGTKEVVNKKKRTSTTTTFNLWKIVGNTTVSNFTITGDID